MKKISLMCLVIISLFVTKTAHADSSVIQSPDNGHSYQRIDSNMSWQDAKIYAEGLGGYLATITSQNEQNLLWNNLGGSDFIWLGGTDEVEEGVWKWVTGETFWLGGINGQPVNGSYTNWANNAEPDNGGAGQDYLVFFPSNYGHNGGWDDYGLPNYNHVKPSIIEWNTQPPVVPEPISSVLFIIGAGVLAGRRCLKRRRT